MFADHFSFPRFKLEGNTAINCSISPGHSRMQMKYNFVWNSVLLALQLKLNHYHVLSLTLHAACDSWGTLGRGYLVLGCGYAFGPPVVIWVEGACWEDLFPRSHTLTLPHVAWCMCIYLSQYVLTLTNTNPKGTYTFYSSFVYVSYCQVNKVIQSFLGFAWV